LIDNDKDFGADFYEEKLSKMTVADLTGFHSSRYRAAAETLYQKYF